MVRRAKPSFRASSLLEMSGDSSSDTRSSWMPRTKRAALLASNGIVYLVCLVWGVLVTQETEALAVYVRSVQWELDEAVFEIAGGQCTAVYRHRLADRLTKLAEALRGVDNPAVIDVISDE
jgi:hypothetical protein